MKTRMLAVLGAGLLFSGAAGAMEIVCKNPAFNHMLVDDAYVSSCLDAGVGNINENDTFGSFVGKEGGSALTSLYNLSVTNNGNDTGSFSLDAAIWSAYSSVAIGFKFGTGGTPDEWFVYVLNNAIISGLWTFVDVLAPGEGGSRFSHGVLYGIPGTPPPPEVPEPTTLGLLGIGLAGLAYAGRRRRRTN